MRPPRICIISSGYTKSALVHFQTIDRAFHSYVCKTNYIYDNIYIYVYNIPISRRICPRPYESLGHTREEKKMCTTEYQRHRLERSGAPLKSVPFVPILHSSSGLKKFLYWLWLLLFFSHFGGYAVLFVSEIGHTPWPGLSYLSTGV